MIGFPGTNDLFMSIQAQKVLIASLGTVWEG